MPLRHILEYEDHEIQDLLGDLETVGHAKEYGGTLWARFRKYRLGEDHWSQNSVYVCFLKTDPIYGTGDETKDKALMLQAIQNGRFFRPEFFRPEDLDARSWADLKSGNSTVVDFLEKSNVQSLAKTCSTMDELLEAIRENLVRAQKLVLRTTYPYREMEDHEIQKIVEDVFSVLVYGFFAPLESTYLATSNPYTPDTPAKAKTIRYKSFEKVDDINYFKD